MKVTDNYLRDFQIALLLKLSVFFNLDLNFTETVLYPYFR